MNTANTDRIERKILLRAPRARVWRAISDSNEFGIWFGMKFDATFAPGKKMGGSITPTKVNADVAAKQKAYEGKKIEIWIEKIEPEKLLSFRWHPFAIEEGLDYSQEPTTLIEFRLEDADGGVMLTVTETGFHGIPLARRAKAFDANSGGWAKQMELIEAYVTGNYGAGANASGAR
jgi:uncharacterized protein YndB with AHSA1/START domain